MREHVDTISKWLLEYCEVRSAECKVGDCRTCTACPQLHYVFAEMDKLVTEEARRRLRAAGVFAGQLSLAEADYRDATSEKSCEDCVLSSSERLSQICVEHGGYPVSDRKVCDKHCA